jgi:peptide/nickel transport system ATP-binding protein
MNSILLQIKNLSIQFCHEHQTVQAVDDISFNVHQGEIVGIVGESGSGKSATAFAIAQLNRNKSVNYLGEINLFLSNSEPINLLSINENEIQKFLGNKIGFIFQDPFTALNPTTKCGKQIVEAILIHQKISFKSAKMQALNWLQKVGLNNADEIYNKYPHQLSGGQLQRVVIAIAMCNNPDLLIADEPTTALDASIQAAIIKLLKSLQLETKMSILFISHDIDVVMQLANKIVVMKSGKVIEEISTDKLLSSATTNYTKSLIECKPSIHSKLKRLPTLETIANKEETIFNDEELLNESKKIEAADTILEIKNLSVNYQSQNNWFRKTIENNAVKNVSFIIKKTETVGIVGESGSGKTSIAKAIVALVKPTQGNIIFKNKSCINLTTSELLNFRKQVQYIFQNSKSSLNPRMKIGEAIEEVIQVHQPKITKSTKKEKAISWLKKVQLAEEYYDRYPNQLSGGQRQRIVIARALAAEPILLIADEPVSNLDVSTQAEILNLLKDLKNEFQLSCLFISHDLAVINFICDKIAVMKDGEIVEINSTNEILKNPKQEYTKQLISATPSIKN